MNAVAYEDLAFGGSAGHPFEQRVEPGWLELAVFEADSQKTLAFQFERITPALRGDKVDSCAISRGGYRAGGRKFLLTAHQKPL